MPRKTASPFSSAQRPAGKHQRPAPAGSAGKPGQHAPNTAKRPQGKPASGLHPRNRHQQRYDFAALTISCPELARYVQPNPHGDLSIDFANPLAVKTLNRALLQHWYGIQSWDIPDGYLCPPIPGRADYIHHLADLLTAANLGKPPAGRKVQVLDIGCGANCIYPLIGHSEYGWQFLASDIETASLDSAQRILDANPTLKRAIQLRHQPDCEHCFTHILGASDCCDLTLCNPPFHESAAAMQAGSERKWRNLGKDKAGNTGKNSNTGAPALNFGGQSNELWCDGGELAFISRMIRESRQYGAQVFWFTSLVSRQANLAPLQRLLQTCGALQQQVIEMSQGQKSSRLLAWTFLTPAQQQVWRQMRWQGR